MSQGKGGGPKRAFTRMWLDDTLKSKDFDALKEFLSVYRESDTEGKRSMLSMVWDRLYPKARPVDEDGEPGELNLQLTTEEIRELAKAARGD